MTDIPEDIRAAADRWIESYDGIIALSSGKDDLLSDAVCELLLAEREATEARTIERCAAIADGKDRNVMWTPAEIAAAIRSQAKE